MYLSLDGEEKARKIRGTENQGERIPDSNLPGWMGPNSVSSESQSFGSDRNGRTTTGRSIGSGKTITGGILRQLIQEYHDQVALKKEEIMRLEARIIELRNLQAELEEDTEDFS